MNPAIRRIRRFLSVSAGAATAPFATANRNFLRARTLVKVYYLASAYICYRLIGKVAALTREAPDWDFLWPLAWVPSEGGEDLLRWLSVACFLASLLAVQFTDRRLVRLLFIVLFLPVATIPNSLGGINHPYHAWFWIGVCFLFLPDLKKGEGPRAAKMSYLTVVHATQALLLAFYSLAGFWKLTFGIHGLVAGYEGNFSPRGLALTLADRILQTGTDPLLAEFLIDNYWLAWVMFLGVIYFQLVAVVVAFRPRLHQIWGFLLISFHLGTYLLMEIGFAQHVLFLMIFFVLSPFRPERLSLREMLCDLPLFGWIFRRAFAGAYTSAAGWRPGETAGA